MSAENFNAPVPVEATTVPTSGSAESGKTGEGGEFSITNNEFIASVFSVLPVGAFVAVATKQGDPSVGGWFAQRFDAEQSILAAEANNYFACASYYVGRDGSVKARKERHAAYHFLLLDDIGTKVPLERLAGFELSWLIETSPNNYQGGIILDEPLTDGAEAERLLKAVIQAGLCDAGATGPLSRWARLPGAINGKPKHADANGAPFHCRLVEWRPDRRYSPRDIVDLLQLELAPTGRPKKPTKPAHASRSDTSHGTIADAADVLVPRAAENPVVAALKARGLYKTALGSGKHDVTCPWVHEHSDALDTGAAYFEPNELHPFGGFCCQHSHGANFHIREFLEFLGLRNSEAVHKALIRLYPGALHVVVDAAEKELANLGRHYQAGGLIVSISIDPASGDPSIMPTTLQSLARDLSIAATWERYDRRAEDWIQCDPPSRHTAILFDARTFSYLPPLVGVARQPYFRESDGELVSEPGYDAVAQRYGVFNPLQFVVPRPTHEAAVAALHLILDLLKEFDFVSECDKSAAISAILTAVARPTLPHAPAFHVRAPIFGSGKTYLCELIGAFTGPGVNAKVSYPATSEEATKVILSLLLTSPAVIEFDDMDTDWLPHGVIKRALTAEYIRDRILGGSRTATVSTRTLMLGSGNNVGPIRDLLRRVLTIHLDPRCATPATKSFDGRPVEAVRQRRGVYVSAVLTIMLAWRAAGSPRAPVSSIANYGGAWSDYCRHPLIWLGLPDPATALLEQVRDDPYGDALGGLMKEWHAAFGSTATTVRRAIEAARNCNPPLLDALCEFPIEEQGEINPSKLGWLLKNNANRIVAGFEFQRTKADGRAAWRVIAAQTPPFTPSPPSDRSA